MLYTTGMQQIKTTIYLITMIAVMVSIIYALVLGTHILNFMIVYAE
jgi:hypothetical protein